MEKEIEFIRKCLDEKYPKNAIKDLFCKKFEDKTHYFEDYLEKAHAKPVTEVKEEKKGIDEVKIIEGYPNQMLKILSILKDANEAGLNNHEYKEQDYINAMDRIFKT